MKDEVLAVNGFGEADARSVAILASHFLLHPSGFIPAKSRPGRDCSWPGLVRNLAAGVWAGFRRPTGSPVRHRDCSIDGSPEHCCLGEAFILRKEVIQPQVPLRLPCYDLVPIAEFVFGA